MKGAKVWKKLFAFLMAFALTVTSIFIPCQTEVQAAQKATGMTVTTKNSVLGSTKTIYVGGPANLKTLQIKAKVKPAKASQKVTYKSSKTSVATVKNGKVTAKKAGKAKITVTSKSNKKIKKVVNISVKKYVYPKTLTVKASTYSLSGGATAKVTAALAPSNTTFKDVTYKTSDASLATVSGKGVVTANTSGKAGKVTITVTAKYQTKAKKTLKKSVVIDVVNNTPQTPQTPQNPVQPEDKTVVSVSSESETLLKTGNKIHPTVTLSASIAPADADQTVTWSSSDETVATVDANGVVTAQATGKADIIATSKTGKKASCAVTVKKSTVAIHDPSVFKDPKSGKYYTIGTGLTLAESSDLQGWDIVKSSSLLFKNKLAELDPIREYTGCKKSAGNFWAADLIYNEEMGKYCMYLCATCDDSHKFKTAIAMCSADDIKGPYSYEGLLVCADFTKDNIDTTNIVSALGLKDASEIPSYYYSESESGTGDSQYYKDNFPDCIDPDPFYGPDGTLYMVYGSFTCYGGIRILKLDPKTGLRSAEYNYDYVEGVSDPYFGKKITDKAGEGPYIQQVKTDKSPTGYYYYLWTSSGILRGTGTYKMSMFRSENPDGPYVDAAGTLATSGGGTVVAYNYKYSFMDMAYTAMGGNSALVDDDGKIFLCYHNKFEDGSGDPGTHMVKIHQMFVNEDGWLVTAPFEYRGETIASSYTTGDIAGDYEFVIHKTGTAAAYGRYNYNKSVAVKLTADGKVSGALEGTWSISGNNVTIKAGNVTYKGVALVQNQDDGDTGENTNVTSKDRTMTLSLLGSDNVTMWASKIVATDEKATEYDASQLTIPVSVFDDFDLPSSGLYGSSISWTSNHEAIVVEGTKAKVYPQIAKTEVTLTATVTKGSSRTTKQLKITVEELELRVSTVVASDSIKLPTSLGDAAVTWESSNSDVISTDGTVKRPTTGYESVTLTATIGTDKRVFHVVVLPTEKGANIYEQDFTGETDASKFLVSTNYQDGATMEVDASAERGDYLQYLLPQSPTNVNSRGAIYDFGLGDQVNGVYTVEFDQSLRAGNNQSTQFVLATQDMKYLSDNMNNGVESGYVFKMEAEANSTTWKINDQDTIELPSMWVHVKAVVDTKNGNATLTITNGTTVMYDGVLKTSGTGALKGLYTRAGRYAALIKMDNVQVY